VIKVHHAAGSKGQMIGERNVRSQRGRFGILGLLLCLALVYGVVVLTGPWAVHIGNGWTPLLYWTGTGKLITKSGTYPLLVSLFPSTHSSQLHLDGLRPSGGVQGRGWLCTSCYDARQTGGTMRLFLAGLVAYFALAGVLEAQNFQRYSNPSTMEANEPKNGRFISEQ
jgi:hypothetical protein